MNEALLGVLAQTERLRIEPLRPELFPDYCAIACHPDTGEFDEEFPKTLESAYEAFQESVHREAMSEDAWNEYGVFTDEGVLVGLLSHYDTPRSLGNATSRMGYHFHPKYHGKGYATEAVGGLMEILFQSGITKVQCVVHPENRRSINLLDRLGFSETSYDADHEELLFTAVDRPF